MAEIVINTGTAGLMLAYDLGLKDPVRSVGDWTRPAEIVFRDEADAATFREMLDARHRELGYKN